MLENYYKSLNLKSKLIPTASKLLTQLLLYSNRKYNKTNILGKKSQTNNLRKGQRRFQAFGR